MENQEQNIENPFLSKEKLLAELRWLRNDFIDEIPEEEVIPYETPNWEKYKCRINYFQAVASALYIIDEEGMIADGRITDDVRLFLNYIYNEKDFSKFTTKEDIGRINQILDEVIKYFSQEFLVEST